MTPDAPARPRPLGHLLACWRLQRFGNPGWAVSFRYDKEVTEELKRCVLARDRHWDRERKVWWVAGLYRPTLRRLFGEAFEAQAAAEDDLE